MIASGKKNLRRSSFVCSLLLTRSPTHYPPTPPPQQMWRQRRWKHNRKPEQLYWCLGMIVRCYPITCCSRCGVCIWIQGHFEYIRFWGRPIHPLSASSLMYCYSHTILRVFERSASIELKCCIENHKCGAIAAAHLLDIVCDIYLHKSYIWTHEVQDQHMIEKYLRGIS